jgi:hypothetical protein
MFERDLVIALADRFRLPAIYSYRFFIKILASYGYEGSEHSRPLRPTLIGCLDRLVTRGVSAD